MMVVQYTYVLLAMVHIGPLKEKKIKHVNPLINSDVHRELTKVKRRTK